MDDVFESEIETIQSLFEKGIIKNRLSQIKIHHFRKFANESEVNFTFPLTVIVGKNGSGKTTVLKAIKVLSKKEALLEEFFETAIDNGGLDGADISYTLDGNNLHYKRIGENKWGVDGTISNNPKVTYIQTKSMIGAIDKSFLYDNLGKHPSQLKNVEYVIKQSKKIKQNLQSNSERKQRYFISEGALTAINDILQENIKAIEVIQHKYYSGTWGKSLIFNDGKQYSEYNSGSGEFVVASMVDLIEKMPPEGLLLLDEPEVSLHPGAQKRLVLYILEKIKSKKIQVVITTHSINIVEHLPPKAIKCFRRIENDTIIIDEDVLYKNAFLELGADIDEKKHILVEDSLAQMIIQKILDEEKLNRLLQVEPCPGGASNIKKYIVPTYSRTGVDNRYIILDGDQKKIDVPEFSEVPEAKITGEYLEDNFESVTGMGSDKIGWTVDANRKAGRYNNEQKNGMIRKYLEFFKKNVFFLPGKIPEGLIYDEEHLKAVLGIDIFPNFDSKQDEKAKLKKLADFSGQEIDALEYQMVYWFIKQKNADYYTILNILKKIIEG